MRDDSRGGERVASGESLEKQGKAGNAQACRILVRPPAWGVTESIDTARRWRGLVCPDCRFVFRVPNDHEGSGVVCPSCRRLLRIPGPDDESPPLLVAEEDKAESDLPRGERKRRRKRKKVSEDTPWEQDVGQERAGKQRSLRMGWQLVVGLILLGGSVIWISHTMQKQPESTSPIRLPEVTDVVVPEAPAVPELWYDKDAVHELCREFLAAASVEELLPLIRNADRLEPEIRRYYADGKVDKMELTGLRVARESRVGEVRALTLLIQTKTFVRQLLNVCETADGLKVDWESWVGQSSMPWAEMMEKKPTDPVLVRVMLSYVEYYNMDFSDDKKWGSCRLLSPDGEHVLYGYVLLGSDEQDKLFRLLAGDPSAENRVSLIIRYPEGARASNQVIVDRIVAESWLIPDTKP